MNRYLPCEGGVFYEVDIILFRVIWESGKMNGKDMAPPAGRAGGILNPEFDMTFYVSRHVIY